MKRFLSLCITLVMLVTLAVPAGAVEDKTATTIRLESTQGTVTVKNSAGTDVKLQSKMRLNDGYSVATKAKSYAYISLDTDRSIKLDASSEVSVAKNGKKLEIAVKTGSIFFDVKNSLSSTEKLNIRTSTMVTGVRGTSGIVTAIDRAHSTIMLLEGQVLVTSFNEDMIRMDSMMVYAGELAYTQPSDLPDDDGTQLLKRKFNESEVPGFAAVEVAKSKDLQNRIDTLTPLESAKIIGDAEQRLAADEAAAQQAAQRVEELLKQQEVEFVDPVFQSEEPVTGGGGGGGSTPPAATTFDLDDATRQSLIDALADYNTVNVNSVNTAGFADTTDDVTVDAGKTLNIKSGATLPNDPDNTMNVDGTINVEAGATLENMGNLNINSTNSIHVYGTLENNGSLNVGTDTAAGLAEITGTLSGPDGMINVAADSTFKATGTITSAGGPPCIISVAPGGKASIKDQPGMVVSAGGTALTATGGTYNYTNDTTGNVWLEAYISSVAIYMNNTQAFGYIAEFPSDAAPGTSITLTLTPDTKAGVQNGNFDLSKAQLKADVIYDDTTNGTIDLGTPVMGSNTIAVPANVTSMDLYLSDVAFTFDDVYAASDARLSDALGDPAITAVKTDSFFSALNTNLTVPAGKTLELADSLNFGETNPSTLTNHGTIRVGTQMTLFGRSAYVGDESSRLEITYDKLYCNSDSTVELSDAAQISVANTLYIANNARVTTSGSANVTCGDLNCAGVYDMQGGMLTATTTGDYSINMQGGTLMVAPDCVVTGYATELIHIEVPSTVRLNGGELYANGTNSYVIYDQNATDPVDHATVGFATAYSDLHSRDVSVVLLYCANPGTGGPVVLYDAFTLDNGGGQYVLVSG